MPEPTTWRTRRHLLSTADGTLIMGILNVTPDSFSDGGRFDDVERAVAHGLEMWEHGAAIVDVGGESTRPGAQGVSVDQELERVMPVIERLAADGVVVSIDTTNAEVARAALAAGAEVVNDVSALSDPAMADVVHESGAGLIVMHMQGTPRTMQQDPRYDDVVAEVGAFLEGKAAEAVEAGIPADHIAVDPGIGFGKRLEHNLELLGSLPRFVSAGYPVVLGTSRKRFIGALTGIEDAADRDIPTQATVALGVAAGVAVLRVHNVQMALLTARMADAIVRAT